VSGAAQVAGAEQGGEIFRFFHLLHYTPVCSVLTEKLK
jgi:hypothetical protein